MADWLRINDLTWLYLIALGSNQRHALLGAPERILQEAVGAMEMDDIDVFEQAPIVLSAAIGPSSRRYANSAVIVATPLNPPELLERLRQIEAHFGRERRGQRWRARTLDLDIILWSGGMWVDDSPLSIPHPRMRERAFVLGPAAHIAPDWRDPMSGLSVRHLAKRLNRPKRLDRHPAAH